MGAGLPANTGEARAIHRGACFAGKPAPTEYVSRLRNQLSFSVRFGSKAVVRRGLIRVAQQVLAQAQILLNGFQDRGISAQSMRHQGQIRFQNKDETARLQAAYCKGRRFGFGIDFQPNCHPSGSHLRSWHRDIKRSMLARAITDLELAP